MKKILFWMLVSLAVFPASACPPRQTAAAKRESADLLIFGGTVVTMDTSRRVLEDGAIAVRGDSILAVGPRAEVETRFDAPKRVDARGKLVMPGLINGHTHVPMVLFRGLAEDLKLDDWLQKYIFPAEERNVTPDFIEWGTRLGLLEMLRSGTTTFTDMYYFEDEIARVTKEAGMRGVLGESILDFPVPDNKTVPDALAYAEKFLKHWQNDPLITAAVAPHSVYTCSEKTLQEAAALARRFHAPILIHVAEARFELEQVREKHGVSPVVYLERIGVLGPDLVAAHCIWVDGSDIQILVQRGVGCVYNPSSNMKLASGVMPATDMLAAGMRVGLGTDGAASNNSLDMVSEMDLAAKLQKLSRGDPRALPAEQAVEMATIGGARALHMEQQIGSLEAGKKADIILVDAEIPGAMPLHNVYAHIVYSMKAADVDTSIIGGKIVMDHRHLLTLDEPQVLEKAGEYAKRVAASLAASPVQ